jgi:hypothetical protein
MSRLACVQPVRGVPQKCTLRARLAHCRCVKRNTVTSQRKPDACKTLAGAGRFERSGKTTSMVRRGLPFESGRGLEIPANKLLLLSAQTRSRSSSWRGSASTRFAGVSADARTGSWGKREPRGNTAFASAETQPHGCETLSSRCVVVDRLVRRRGRGTRVRRW